MLNSEKAVSRNRTGRPKIAPPPGLEWGIVQTRVPRVCIDSMDKDCEERGMSRYEMLQELLLAAYPIPAEFEQILNESVYPTKPPKVPKQGKRLQRVNQEKAVSLNSGAA